MNVSNVKCFKSPTCKCLIGIFSDSKKLLKRFKLATQWKKHSLFGTFLVGGGDIRYWLEMTSFWFVMVSLVTSNVGG